MFKKRIHFSSKGFTLVELLVVIIILAVLAMLLLITLDPFAQLDKAKNAQRKQDLTQIRSALDTFYNDNNYYPAIVPFGSTWTVGNTVYMEKVPQDPDCYTTGNCYYYQTSSNPADPNYSATPQWNVLYARYTGKFIKVVRPNPNCPLPAICANTSPFNTAAKYNYCVISGALDDSSCKYISSNVPVPIVPTPLPTARPTPTPTSVPMDCTGHYWAKGGGAQGCGSIGNPRDVNNGCNFNGKGPGPNTCYPDNKCGSTGGLPCTQ